jgi:hypothetical protein
MATFEKKKLSGTFAGNIPLGILPYDNAIVHATGTSSTIQDEVWLWVASPAAGATNVIQFDYACGGNSASITLEIQPNATILAIAGLPLSGDGTDPSSITLNNTGSDNISVSGFVNRITP